MKYLKYFIGSFVIIVAIVIIIPFIKTNANYDLESYERFVTELKGKGYTVKQEDVDKSILAGQRKWLTINENENISVYIYKNQKRMEKDAGYVSSDGFSYNSDYNNINISWVSEPHFFKRDNIIVLYVGNNKEIMNHLEKILGKQFAGV